jgi:hypothetical protein
VVLRHQRRFSIDVWVGILDDQFIRQIILPNRLTGAVYHHFLFVNDIPVWHPFNSASSSTTNMWPVHEGTASSSPHCQRAPVPDLGKQCIGRGDLVNWSARSFDLNSMDFCLWGYLNNSVYLAPINVLELLQQRVKNACQEIRVKRGFFDRLRSSVRRRT